MNLNNIYQINIQINLKYAFWNISNASGKFLCYTVLNIIHVDLDYE